jgi:hypothetical protein
VYRDLKLPRLPGAPYQPQRLASNSTHLKDAGVFSSLYEKRLETTRRGTKFVATNTTEIIWRSKYSRKKGTPSGMTCLKSDNTC